MADEGSGKSFELTNLWIISNNCSGYIVQFHVNINLNIFPMQIFLIHVHVPEDLRPQQKIANIYFNAALADDWHGLERYDLVPYHAAHAQKQWRLRAAAGKSVEESLANKQSRRIYELSSTQSGST
ncbi:uncharacterized protein LOC124646429 [Lolium rigidum]|uniref:uncharacterized protein LOC124646429 n=1 Tax=Lolium rigidum TaxID=89674 RepID=UPI001F5DA512|nr:uncharacterized protein LOC124646429 [Lolium rigidum]